MDSCTQTMETSECFSVLSRLALNETDPNPGSSSPDTFLFLSKSAMLLYLIGITSLYLAPYLQIFPKPVSRALHGLRILLEDSILVLITISWMLALAPAYGIILIWRMAVHLHLKLRYGELGGLVQALDAIGTIDTAHSRQIIKSLKVLEGDWSLEDLRARCLRTVGKTKLGGGLVYPKFYSYLDRMGGFFCWRPAKFDIEHHVRLVEGLDENGPSTSESKALGLLSGIANDEFEAGRPGWEILVIPKFHYDEESERLESEEWRLGPKYGIIIRIHHSIGDGYSLLKLILKDMAGEPDMEAIPKSVRPLTPLWLGALIFLYMALKSPRALYREMLANDLNPLHCAGRRTSGVKTIVWSQPIGIPFLKETKNKMGTGMVTVLLTALVGSVRKYMLEEFNETPESLSVVLPMPAPNHPDNKMTNKFSVVMLPLECRSEDPMVRSKGIERAGKEMARSPDAPLNLFLMRLAGVLPVYFIRFFLTNAQSTLIVSNLPGPSRDISIWGSKLVETMFWLPSLGDSGVSVSFLSYRDQMRIGLTTDSGVIPEGLPGAQRLLNGLTDGILEMATRVGVSTEAAFCRPILSSSPTYVGRPRAILSRGSLTDSNSSDQSDEEEEDRVRDYYLNQTESEEEEEPKVPVRPNRRNLLSHRHHSSFKEKSRGKFMGGTSIARSNSASRFMTSSSR